MVEPAAQVHIREERPEDVRAIRDVNRRAFGQDVEGALVDALRANGAALVSLVATIDSQVVGHIMYSPATIGDVSGAALGPMAVLPELQRRGIGSRLVEAGNDQLARAGHPFIIVLGHPEFYPRFGFTPAKTHGITCAWAVPEDVFMILVIDEARLRGVTGLARYRAEFS